MPTYSYKCDACQEEFDRILPISRRHEPREEACGKCGKKEIVTQIKANANSIVSTVNTQGGKVPEGFKDVLRTIKKNSGRGNVIDV